MSIVRHTISALIFNSYQTYEFHTRAWMHKKKIKYHMPFQSFGIN